MYQRHLGGLPFGGLSGVTWCPPFPNNREPEIVSGMSMHNMAGLKRAGLVHQDRGIWKMTEKGLARAEELFSDGSKQ